MTLQYRSDFGDLTIDLSNLTVQSTIDWAKLWKESKYDISIFADYINRIFDTLYENYGIEHNFEPSLYEQTLGDFSVTLSNEHNDYLLSVCLKDNSAVLTEQQTIYKHLE